MPFDLLWFKQKPEPSHVRNEMYSYFTPFCKIASTVSQMKWFIDIFDAPWRIVDIITTVAFSTCHTISTSLQVIVPQPYKLLWPSYLCDGSIYIRETFRKIITPPKMLLMINHTKRPNRTKINAASIKCEFYWFSLRALIVKSRFSFPRRPFVLPGALRHKIDCPTGNKTWKCNRIYSLACSMFSRRHRKARYGTQNTDTLLSFDTKPGHQLSQCVIEFINKTMGKVLISGYINTY